MKILIGAFVTLLLFLGAGIAGGIEAGTISTSPFVALAAILFIGFILKISKTNP